MTTQQKDAIRSMRLDGTSYTKIAAALGLSVNTVKSSARRCSDQQTQDQAEGDTRRCLRCGAQYTQPPMRKSKLYCSSKCRQAWWYANRAHSKTARRAMCARCGTSFPAKRDQKYCSHVCYIRTRFGGDGHAQHTI